MSLMLSPGTSALMVLTRPLSISAPVSVCSMYLGCVLQFDNNLCKTQGTCGWTQCPDFLLRLCPYSCSEVSEIGAAWADRSGRASETRTDPSPDSWQINYLEIMPNPVLSLGLYFLLYSRSVGLLISQVWSVFRRWLFWHLVWSLTRRQSRSVRYWLTSNKLEWVLRRLSSPAHFKYLLALILWSISVLLAGKITTCVQCTPRSEDKSLETGAIGGCELPRGC